ncbi:hypothetical protein N7508_009676 [Penicillium antarcticum]|uniref:uncharacterized protein n=1 Tax=Penicillium antarcticum TaxID=416450 RepID=UPI0023859CE4|nr:uncharacterized protein N7508_009676 [Penicillium antarcticum]KAJ5294855.1 hypothetical protein N7508_009676 [Penicillium antarcticum]
MDAQAYLMRHGWGGPGNPLQPNTRPGPHGGLGLTRPILVARKANNHGVGKKTTKDPTNQWWLRGFEDALKGVGDESHEGVSARAGNALTSELYRNFVRGDGLAGTLNSKDGEKTEAGTGEKRKTGDEEKAKETKEERRARKAAKKERKEKRAVARVAKKERKDKRAVARTERRKKKEEKRAARKAKEKDVAGGEDYPTPMSIDSGSGSGSEKTEAEAETVSAIKEKKVKKAKSDDGSKKSKKDKKAKKSESKA